MCPSFVVTDCSRRLMFEYAKENARTLDILVRRNGVPCLASFGNDGRMKVTVDLKEKIRPNVPDTAIGLDLVNARHDHARRIKGEI